MKIFFRYVYIILLSFFISFHLQGQDVSPETGFLKEGSLIIRVKENYRNICSDKMIDHAQFLDVLTEIGNGHVSKMFPMHSKPGKATDDYGNALIDLSLIYIAEFSPDFPLAIAANLLMSTGITQYAEPYVIPELLYVPNDPFAGNQYYLTRVKAYEAWDIWKGDTNFIVGITDTGYEFNHPDLVSAVKYNYNDTIDGIDNDNDGYVDNFMGWNLGENNNNPQYGPVGHGIHVSGIAGASADNTFGIAGVGFHTKLLPVRIDNSVGLLTMSYQGIVYAADHGAKVINCSWGSTFGAGQFGQDIVSYATFNRGALVVAAAGNANSERMYYPCAYQNVLCVAATKADDSKWENSSFYHRVDISAPGHNIYSTWANGSFVYSGGTSMAAPIISGAAALVWSLFPQLGPLQIAQHLKNTSDIIDTLSSNLFYNDKLGYGRLNMFRALSESLKPGIKLDSLSITDHNNDVFQVNDTLFITGNFINLLAATQNLQITLQCNSPYVQLIDTVFNAGVQNSLLPFNNSGLPFRLKILPGIPSSSEIEMNFKYSDIDYSGYDYTSITANIDFLDLSVNDIKTTITSKGTLGYNDNLNYLQGIGLTFLNSSSLISCASFMAGQANNQVSDNSYGFTTEFDSDLVSENSVVFVAPPLKGDQQITGIFNDSGAGSQTMNIRVLHDEFAWDSQSRKNFIIADFSVINMNSSDMNNLYVGYFTDWELKTRSQNKAATNAALRFGYVYSLDSSLYAAVQLLTPGNFLHYAIDDDGQDASVNLNDGFSSTEKFMTLSNTRTTAGNSPFGNYVSSVVSSGPFMLPAGDTLNVAFAIHVTDTYVELLQSVNNAKDAWNEIVTAGISPAEKSDPAVYPNPFSDFLYLKTDSPSGISSIEIVDLTGRRVYSANTQQNGIHAIELDFLCPGPYILRITGEEVAVRQIIKL